MSARHTAGRRVVRRVVAGGAVVAAALLAAGCSDPDPEPRPSKGASSSRPATVEPEPSPTPSQYDPVTAAKAAYSNYMDVQNAVSQDYFRDWDTKVIPLLTGDFSWNRRQISESYGGGQYYQVGEDKVLSRTVTNSDEWEVVMNVCIDSRSVHIIGPGGASVGDGRPEPRVAVVTVVRTAPMDERGFDTPDPVGQEWWRIADSITQEGATCSS